MMQQVNSKSGSASATRAEQQQYLTFLMADEEYGIDILRVQEIRVWSKPMSLPSSPKYVKGVINLRGSIVPVIDLRERLGLDAPPYGPTTVVIVLKVMQAGANRIVGIVVDAVSDVYNIGKHEIQPAPDFSSEANRDYTRGIVTLPDKMILLFDVDRLFCCDNLERLAAAA